MKDNILFRSKDSLNIGTLLTSPECSSTRFPSPLGLNLSTYDIRRDKDPTPSL